MPFIEATPVIEQMIFMVANMAIEVVMAMVVVKTMIVIMIIVIIAMLVISPSLQQTTQRVVFIA